MSTPSSLWKRGLIIVGFSAVLLLAAGCQTFRTSQFALSESEKERDQKIGEAVETGGMTLYWLSQILPWFQ